MDDTRSLHKLGVKTTQDIGQKSEMWRLGCIIIQIVKNWKVSSSKIILAKASDELLESHYKILKTNTLHKLKYKCSFKNWK